MDFFSEITFDQLHIEKDMFLRGLARCLIWKKKNIISSKEKYVFYMII